MYMMAYYLLPCQVDKVAAHIHRLENFGFKKLPRYYEEALVIHMGPEWRVSLFLQCANTVGESQQPATGELRQGSLRSEKDKL